MNRLCLIVHYNSNEETMPKLILKLQIVFFLLITTAGCAQANLNVTAQNNSSEPLVNDNKISITVADKKLRIEYADSPTERQLGLMYRRALCEDCGMLFKFDSQRIGSIWMKNTYIPLDLAYISANGEIIDIFPLQPHDLTAVKSSEKVLYALEMNQGWFAKQDIRVGDRVTELP